MKTTKEWLETLPEPYRTQALNNADVNWLKDDCPSLKRAVIHAFKWDKTEQGFEYWRDLHNTL